MADEERLDAFIPTAPELLACYILHSTENDADYTEKYKAVKETVEKNAGGVNVSNIDLRKILLYADAINTIGDKFLEEDDYAFISQVVQTCSAASASMLVVMNTLNTVGYKVFPDSKVSWSRIGGLIILLCAVYKGCLANGQGTRVSWLVQFFKNFVTIQKFSAGKHTIGNWVESNGGWAALQDAEKEWKNFESRCNPVPDMVKEMPAPDSKYVPFQGLHATGVTLPPIDLIVPVMPLKNSVQPTPAEPTPAEPTPAEPTPAEPKPAEEKEGAISKKASKASARSAVSSKKSEKSEKAEKTENES